MALNATTLREHLNGVPDTDEVLTRLLGASTTHVERLLGYKLTDIEKLPDGPPADLEQAVLMLAADWYENREASLVGVSAQPIPFGVREIVNEHRNYTFGASSNGG